MYHVYILLCSDNSFYTGISYNAFIRFNHHQSGKGALYTKSRRPLRLVYVEECSDKIKAARREKVIKDLSQVKKKKLIKSQKNCLLRA